MRNLIEFIENGTNEVIRIDSFELNPSFDVNDMSKSENKDLIDRAETIMSHFYPELWDTKNWDLFNPEFWSNVYEFVDYYFIVNRNKSIKFPKSSFKIFKNV